MTRILRLLCCAIAAGGCARLATKVAIFDPRGVSHDDLIAASVRAENLRVAQNIAEGAYLKAAIELERLIGDYIETLVDAKAEIALEDKDAFLSEISTSVNAAVREAEASYREAQRQGDRAELASSAATRRERYRSALASLQKGHDRIERLFREALQETDGLSKRESLPVIAAKKRDEVDRTAARLVGSLTMGQDLLDDPLAPVVISSPSSYWTGEYNHTQATALLGNADIAIKMETLGTFTLKGLRLDASKITQATFQVVRQTVKIIAAAYGVPLAGGTMRAAGAADNGDADPELAALKIRKARVAALAIADAIVAERAAVSSTDVGAAAAAARQAAVLRIQQAFEAYKTGLSPEGPTR